MGKPNRLQYETSPYLRQHAQNPVDWFPWGKEALEKSKRDNKPIFLSIGYSACHWCHVMEKESFEDEQTAKLMNESFVNVKVDREERPDLDHIYMSAVQLLTQHGGWPMSVFLTPELEPFYGGTYFPPVDRMGMPSFRKILAGVANAWVQRRDEVHKTAKQLTQAIHQLYQTQGEREGALSLALYEGAQQALENTFDFQQGGMGSAPKFFHSMSLRVSLRHWHKTGNKRACEMVALTLDKIAKGGIYDQLGGGFHRYSTDEVWLVPHFEKMLYDNALLTQLYMEAYQSLKDPSYLRIAQETLDYVLREMTSPEGAFYSTQDADSEGEEGRFYVWTKAEITKLLGTDLADLFCRIYNVREGGNWEGKNIPHLTQSLDDWAKVLGTDIAWIEDGLAAAKRKLFAARSKRAPPHRDEKVLVSWNGLMVESFALGYQVLEDERYLRAAQDAARFLLDHLGPGKSRTGALLHCYKDGQAKVSGYVDDYAFLINALVTLYEADFDPDWLKAAQSLTHQLLDQFWEPKEGQFFFTPKNHEKLIARPKELQDGALPAGFSVAVTALIRLGRLCQNPLWLDVAETALKAHRPWMSGAPTAAGQSLIALALLLDKGQELALIPASAEDEHRGLRAIRSQFLPNKVLACARSVSDSAAVPLLTGKSKVSGQTTLFVCEANHCNEPWVGIEVIEKNLSEGFET